MSARVGTDAATSPRCTDRRISRDGRGPQLSLRATGVPERRRTERIRAARLSGADSGRRAHVSQFWRLPPVAAEHAGRTGFINAVAAGGCGWQLLSTAADAAPPAVIGCGGLRHPGLSLMIWRCPAGIDLAARSRVAGWIIRRRSPTGRRRRPGSSFMGEVVAAGHDVLACVRVRRVPSFLVSEGVLLLAEDGQQRLGSQRAAQGPLGSCQRRAARRHVRALLRACGHGRLPGARRPRS